MARNDLYLVMEKADFERGGKSSGKNIQVTIVVLDNNGRLIEVTSQSRNSRIIRAQSAHT